MHLVNETPHYVLRQQQHTMLQVPAILNGQREGNIPKYGQQAFQGYVGVENERLSGKYDGQISQRWIAHKQLNGSIQMHVFAQRVP